MFSWHKKTDAYIRKSGTRDLGLLVGSKAQDAGPISWVARGTLNMGSETQDPIKNWDLEPETRHPKVGTRDPRPRILKVDFHKIYSVFSDAWRS